MDMEHRSWHYWKMKLSQFKHMRLLTPVSKGGRGKYQGALGEKNFFCFFIGTHFSIEKHHSIRPSKKSYYFAFLRESGIFKGHFGKTFVPTMCKSQENGFSLGSKICSILENLIASMGQFGTFFILLVNRLFLASQFCTFLSP